MKHIELVVQVASGELVHVCVPFEEGMTAGEVVRKSAILRHYPEVQYLPWGVFAKSVDSDARLKPGDRLEWYQPLQADPKQKRRERAKR